AILRDDLRLHRRARHEGRAHGDLVAADHEHLVERDLRADVAGELLDPDAVAFGDAVLLAAGLDDCVGHDGFRPADSRGRQLYARAAGRQGLFSGPTTALRTSYTAPTMSKRAPKGKRGEVVRRPASER